MQFGPTTFQGTMVREVEKYIGQFAIAYLDEIIIWSENWDDIRHLNWTSTTYCVSSQVSHRGATVRIPGPYG
ncbi:hypothetical protein PR048_005953 [Dryococelus australis]|uniref:Reverse transcriptase domain-containing protein n=1 Tax=Dryococelus australis TaxID=614101 RepID=A0ABQ9IA75_9NEOP|nr:hypothetical protein PR048_005953 [Dryococelus australis]